MPGEFHEGKIRQHQARGATIFFALLRSFIMPFLLCFYHKVSCFLAQSLWPYRFISNYLYKLDTNYSFCGIFVRSYKREMSDREQFISSSSVKKHGRTEYYKMLEKARHGELIQVRRGVYATSEQLSGNMIDINSIVPDGILCLWSAWSIHRLTTSMPQAFHVAVRRNKKITVPAFPQMEIHYYTDKVLNVGVSKMTIDGFSVNVYDVERCVCDAVKFRNKVGMDVCSEIINNYLERPERNISRLMDYARILRVSATLEKYLEVIL